MDSKIDDESILSELVYNQNKFEEEYHDLKIELEFLNERNLSFNKEYLEEELNTMKNQIEDLEREILIYRKKEIHLNEIENPLERRLLYNHLCFLFGINDKLDRELYCVFEDFHILYRDGNGIKSTAKRGDYYFYFNYVTS